MVMATYIVSYDLQTPGKDYKDLIDALKSYGTYWHNLGSTWCIVTSKTHVEVRDHLRKHIDANDKLLVAKSGKAGAWHGFKKDGSDWLREHL
jgi:hypothetical protein